MAAGAGDGADVSASERYFAAMREAKRVWEQERHWRFPPWRRTTQLAVYCGQLAIAIGLAREDGELAAAREAAALLLQRARGFEARGETIFNGKVVAAELTRHAQDILARARRTTGG